MASRSAILAIRIIADAAGGRKGLEETATGVDKFEARTKAASVKAAAALSAIGAGAMYAAGKASDLGESVNAVEKVFGPASSTIADFGKQAAANAGLSQRAFNDLATRTGALLTNMGYSQKQAADSTTVLAQRAADMASVFNTDVGTALEAINAGLRGEAEPLRAFGVGLSDAAVKGKALELGLYSGKGALDANAKAAATQALILEQTAKVAGDFADTSDSAANKQRILTAQVENLAASFGQQLLPYLEQGLQILSGLLDWIGRNQGATRALVVAVAALAGGVLAANAGLRIYRATQTLITGATLAWQGAQKLLNLALTMNPIGLVVAAIALLVAGVVLAYQKSETFRNIVNKLAAVLRGAVLGAVNAVRGAFDSLVGGLRSAWEWMGRMIDKAKALADKLNPLKAITGIFGGGSRMAAAGPMGTPLRTVTYAATSSTTDGPTIIVNGSLNPQRTAQELGAMLAGARVRTGYAGIRA